MVTIRPSQLPPLEPNDRFSFGPTVLDFWQWAMSDLRMNIVRGYLAEFMVSSATNPELGPRVEWAPFDVEAEDGTRIEVKASGYLQSWTSTTPTTPRWTYKSIDAEYQWNEEKAVTEAVNPDDRVDVWVFALQTCDRPKDYDPLDSAQWSFRVVSHRLLRSLPQRSIGIRGLENAPLRAGAVTYEQLGDAVAAATSRNAELQDRSRPD